MILSKWMDAVGCRITSGSDYLWNCYGSHAYSLDSDTDSICVSVIFNRQDQTVFEITLCDTEQGLAWRWIDPKRRAQHDEECARRQVNDVAWDQVEYVNLETADQILEQVVKMTQPTPTDEVDVPVDLDRDMLFDAMLLAHERNITLNQLINEALREAVEEYERDPTGMQHRVER